MILLSVWPDLEIRLLEERYAPEMFSVIDANRGYLRTWLPWVDGTRSIDDVVTFIRHGLEQFAHNEGFHGGIWWRNQYCGGLGLRPINWQDSKVEIGYWLVPSAQGHGVVTACCRRLARYLFCELNLHRVEMRIAVGNDRSIAVARRIGAVLEGIERESTQVQGKLVDAIRFGLLREDLLG
jgi:ribosomal-protein-serine acetyltransferase